MLGKPIKIFSIKGVPVKISLLALILIGFGFVPVPFSLILAALQLGKPGQGNFDYLSLLNPILLPVGLFGSILVHELAHALVGMRLGSRVTGIDLHLLGGATYFEARPPAYFKDLAISMAGPLSNVALWKLLDLASVGLTRPGASYAILEIAGTISFIGIVNLVLAVFNALPVFPLDGGQAAYALIMGITYRQKFAAGVVCLSSLSIVLYLLFGPSHVLGTDPISVGFLWYISFWVLLSCYVLYMHADSLANFYPTPEAQYQQVLKTATRWNDRQRSTYIFAQGLADWKKGRYVEALGSFTQALELDPKEWRFLEQRARALVALGEYAPALNDYNELIKKEPKREEFFTARAEVLQGLGMLREAMADLKHALTLNPLQAKALVLEAEVTNALAYS